MPFYKKRVANGPPLSEGGGSEHRNNTKTKQNWLDSYVAMKNTVHFTGLIDLGNGLYEVEIFTTN
jgi:hypothetical protein